MAYDIDIFDDCQDAKLYKCSSDNRILHKKLAPNQYQPVSIDPRIDALKYIYTGIPTKLKNGYYLIPHQEIKPMFLTIKMQNGDFQYQQQYQQQQIQRQQFQQIQRYQFQQYQRLALIQDNFVFINLQENFVGMNFMNNPSSEMLYKSQIQKTVINNFLLLQFELFNYDFKLMYFIDDITNTASLLQSDVKYNKNQLVYLSESALFWNITITSIFVDIILELLQIFIVYLWNLLKHKILSRQLNKQLQQANEKKTIELQCHLEHQIHEELALQKEKLKTDIQHDIQQNIQHNLQQTIRRNDVIMCPSQNNDTTNIVPAVEISNDEDETRDDVNIVSVD